MRILFVALLLTACSGGPPESKPAAEAAKKVEAKPVAAKPADDHAAHAATPEVGAFVPLDPKGKRVFFVDIKDGAKVKGPIKVKMGAEGVEVKPAGDVTANSGHHHLIIDGKPIIAGQAVPKDEKNIHFGKGETETEVTLAPGPHMLTLQMADFAHRSYGPALSATISITVE